MVVVSLIAVEISSIKAHFRILNLQISTHDDEQSGLFACNSYLSLSKFQLNFPQNFVTFISLNVEFPWYEAAVSVKADNLHR